MQPPIPKNRTVKIIFILGLTSIFLCICAVVTVLMISRSFFDTDPTIAAFMEAGIQNDLETVHPMLSSQHFMTDQTIEALFEKRELFEGFVSVGKFRGLDIYNYKIENMHISVMGDLNYTNGKRGYYSADLVYQQAVWKIKSIHVALYDE